jgi:hypothetical protein
VATSGKIKILRPVNIEVVRGILPVAVDTEGLMAALADLHV